MSGAHAKQITAAERKGRLRGQEAGLTCRVIGACAALFAGSPLCRQQVQFPGSVTPTGVASPTLLSLTLRRRDRARSANQPRPAAQWTGERSCARLKRLRSLQRAPAASDGGDKREHRANRSENPRDQLSSPRLFHSDGCWPVRLH